MLKQTFYPREDQVDKLDLMSKETGAPKAELIRRALDEYIRRWKWVNPQNRPKTV
jgi:hypothetical protein